MANEIHVNGITLDQPAYRTGTPLISAANRFFVPPTDNGYIPTPLKAAAGHVTPASPLWSPRVQQGMTAVRPVAPAQQATVVAPVAQPMTQSASASAEAVDTQPAMAQPAAPMYTPPEVSGQINTGQPTRQVLGVGNQVWYVPTQDVQAGDSVSAANAFGHEYASAMARGVVPVVSNAQQAAIDRYRARGRQAALAENATADAYAAQRLMSDPNLQAQAAQVAQAQGISMPLAMRYVMGQNAQATGDYRVMNNLYMRETQPMQDTEQAQNLAVNTAFGVATPNMRNPDGSVYYGSGVNATREAPDGTWEFDVGPATLRTGNRTVIPETDIVARAGNPAQMQAAGAQTQLTNRIASAAQAQKNAASQVSAAQKSTADVMQQQNKMAELRQKLLREQYRYQNPARPAAAANTRESMAHQRAAELRRLADSATDPAVRQQYLDAAAQALGVTEGGGYGL